MVDGASDAGGIVSDEKRLAARSLSFVTFADGVPLLLRDTVCSFTTLADVLACQQTSRTACRCAVEDKWLKHCILSGNVGVHERRSLWWHCTGVEVMADRLRARLSAEEDRPLSHEQSFEVVAERKLRDGQASEIERDVHRTFPTHPKFCGAEGSSYRESLSKVLRAVAFVEPGVGYCQGMNFVAATLLIHLGRASDAFWILLATVNHCHFRNIFSPGVPLLPLRVAQFSGIVRERMPRLWRHLKDENFSLDIFAHQCVLTLFAYSIEPEFLAYIYDIFFWMGWKAIFKVGVGLLADMEGKLLGMSIEDISRFMHQCKRKLPGDPASSMQERLRHLLRFKVSRASLLGLQRSFQLQRWEMLLRCACREQDNGAAFSAEPLPAGLERSKCGGGYLLDARAFRTENDPAWRARRPSGSEDGINGVEVACGPQVVPFDSLCVLKAELDTYDMQTQQDVSRLRNIIAETDKELAVLVAETKDLRQVAKEAESERQEWQEYKRALMDTLNAAVKTSPAVRPEQEIMRTGCELTQAVRVGQDNLVLQCLQKLNKVESDIFEKSHRWQTVLKDVEPVQRDICELRGRKLRTMEKLSSFIDARAVVREELLGASLYRVLPDARIPSV